MFHIDAGVELVKFQSVVVHPWILFAEDIEIARHGACRIIAFGHGDAEQPGGFKCGIGKAVHGELDAEQRLGVDYVFAAETEGAAEVEPVIGMRFAACRSSPHPLPRWLWAATSGALRDVGNYKGWSIPSSGRF